MIQEAKELAEQFHAKDTRADGRPYIVHPELVANLTTHFLQTVYFYEVSLAFHKEIIAAAWLHDVIEDHSDVINLDYIEVLFGKSVRGIVALLSNRDHEYYLDYLLSLTNTGTFVGISALIIKRADIIANYYDAVNFPSKNKHQMKHLRNKSEMAYYILFGEKIYNLDIFKKIKKGEI